MKNDQSLAVSACIEKFSEELQTFQTLMMNAKNQYPLLQQSQSILSTPEYNAQEADFTMQFMLDSQSYMDNDFPKSNEKALNTLNSLASNNDYAKVALFKIHAAEVFEGSKKPIYKCFQLSRDPVLGLWYLAKAAATIDSAKKLFQKVITTIAENPADTFSIVLNQKLNIEPKPAYGEELANILAISKEAVQNKRDIPYQNFNPSKGTTKPEAREHEPSPNSSPSKIPVLQ